MKLKHSMRLFIIVIVLLLATVIFNLAYEVEIHIPVAEASEVKMDKEECTSRRCLAGLVILEMPELFEIVRCESDFRHYDKNGDVLSSHTEDYGLFQINKYWWQDTADKLGHDIMSVDGNLAMAKHILKVQGKEAWVCNRLIQNS